MERIESALEIAEGLALPETFSQALNTKAIMLVSHGRRLEGAALFATRSRSRSSTTSRPRRFAGYFNLADSLSQADRYEEAESAVRDGLAYARRVGNRYQELLFLGQSYALFALGKWDEALEWAAELPEDWMPSDRRTRPSRASASRYSCTRATSTRPSGWSTLLDDFATSADAQERAASRLRPGSSALGAR